MELTRELTNHLFHLAQTRTQSQSFGIIGAQGGIPRACFSLNENPEGHANQIMAQLQAEGLAPFATFALAEDLSAPPERPQPLALPSLPHLVIGTRVKGVLEIDAYLEGPTGWSAVELRLPEV
ncbi:MAG: hypothetical protein RLZ25_1668 [Pseudomonadota bacterium]